MEVDRPRRWRARWKALARSDRWGLLEQAVLLIVGAALPVVLVYQIGWILLRSALMVPFFVLFLATVIYSIRFIVRNWSQPKAEWGRAWSDSSSKDQENLSAMENSAQDPTDAHSAVPFSEVSGQESTASGDSRRPQIVEILGILTGVSGIVYAVARVALTRFYGELGTTPEEVGWDLQATLSGFIPVVLIVAAIVTLLVTSLALVGNAMSHLTGRLIDSDHGHSWFSHWRNGVALGVVASIVVLIAGMLHAPRWLAQEVSAGNVPDSSLLSLLPIQPSCVELVNPKMPGLGAGEPLILLGRDDGVVVLFDPRRHVPVRVGTGSVQIVGSEECESARNPWWLA